MAPTSAPAGSEDLVGDVVIAGRRVEAGGDLGDRRIEVEAGEAAEFPTMTPHVITALDGPAELLMVFDRDGRGAHLTGSTA